MDPEMEQHDLLAPVWHTDGVKACVMHELTNNFAYRSTVWLGATCWIFCVVLLAIIAASGTLELAEFLNLSFWIVVGFVAWGTVFALMAYGFGYFRSRFQTKQAVYEAENILLDTNWTDDDL